MGSVQPPKTAFSNDDLVELEWVFASVCEELETKNGKQDADEKECIRRRLFVLACNGMIDPRTLRDHLMRSFTRSEKSFGAKRAAALAD